LRDRLLRERAIAAFPPDENEDNEDKDRKILECR
jgi:hypothetical protein